MYRDHQRVQPQCHRNGRRQPVQVSYSSCRETTRENNLAVMAMNGGNLNVITKDEGKPSILVTVHVYIETTREYNLSVIAMDGGNPSRLVTVHV